MSLDSRLRSEFAQIASEFTYDYEADLGNVLRMGRRRIVVRRTGAALAGLALVAIALFTAPQVASKLGIQRIGTADQPGNTEGNGLGPEGSSLGPAGEGGERTDGGPLAPGAGLPLSGTLPGTQGSSTAKGSGSGGSLPAGKVPVGLEIAFNQGSDIYLMNSNGASLRKLISGVAPGWSPDGKRIAFSDNNDYTGGDLRSMNADGSDSQSLGARGTFPTWSPDGGRLAFNWPCDEQAGRPCSPEQPELACGPECGIGIVARDGAGIRRLGTGLWPDWGPSGRIIFGDGMPSEPCEYSTTFGTFAGDLRVRQPECALPIWVMNPDGSGRTRLPVDQAITPTWSADGRKIAYYTEAGVFIANADGTGIVNVAPARYMHPSWSPDGLWLALSLSTEGWDRRRIYVRAIDGSNERQLTSGPSDTLPTFSPQR